MSKRLERQILEDELSQPPEESVVASRQRERRPKRGFRGGVAKMFDDMNGCYDKARGFYRGLSKFLGNKKDPFA